MTVYIDILILVNFIIDYFLIMLSSKFLHIIRYIYFFRNAIFCFKSLLKFLCAAYCVLLPLVLKEKEFF